MFAPYAELLQLESHLKDKLGHWLSEGDRAKADEYRRKLRRVQAVIAVELEDDLELTHEG
jgi:hypothetical protein